MAAVRKVFPEAGYATKTGLKDTFLSQNRRQNSYSSSYLSLVVIKILQYLTSWIDRRPHQSRLCTMHETKWRSIWREISSEISEFNWS